MEILIEFGTCKELEPPIYISKHALKVFEKKGFPTKKDEAWKYTSLLNLVNQDYSLFPSDVTNIELKEVKKYFLYDT